jgi:hypothetical protein
VLLENDAAVLAARDGNTPPREAVVACMAGNTRQRSPILVGRSTVFFASLVYWDLMRGGKTEASLSDAVVWAQRNQQRWTRECNEAWQAASATRLSGPFDRAIYSEKIEAGTGARVAQTHSYLHEWEEWNASSKDLGIVSAEKGQNPGEPQIQLWRAQGAVGRYIWPGGEKRNQINELVRRLSEYQAAHQRSHPFNCLFLGQPGWGKSFLAKSLAQKFSCEYVSFSIAGMA